MVTTNIYLTFNGNCKAAFDFYQSILGGTFPYVGKFGDMPPDASQPPMPEADKEKIMHISLPISKETILMGSDCGSDWNDNFKQGNNFAISVNTESKDEATRIFEGLSDAGTVTMPLQETFWGAFFGMWTDKFGINWMVNYDDPAKVQPH